ncbi:MAG: helix-turn-helix transcriptional regulator [Anaerolineales bacterium]|jgi:putative transcriptional regulator
MGNSRIHNNIRTLRFFHDEMTQQQLAEKVGVTRQTIIAMEQEKYSPSLELAFRIAQVFEVPLEEVFSFEAEPEQAANLNNKSKGKS